MINAMAEMTKQKWAVGDVFLVQTSNGLGTIGQIIAQEKSVLNSVSCAFFDIRAENTISLADLPSLSASQIFAVLFVTRDLLDEGVWRVLGKRPIDIKPHQKPYEVLRKKEYVGAKVIGSGIIVEFINAFYGLVPWNDWKDPQYLDRLLISPEKKPRQVLLK